MKNQDTHVFSSAAAAGMQGTPAALLFFGGVWYACKHPLHVVRIAERRAELTARNVVNAIFVFLAALGFCFVLYEIWQFQESGLSGFDFFSQRSPSFLVFSLSLIFDLAVIARFGRMKDEYHELPHIDSVTKRVQANASSWDQVEAFAFSASDVYPYVTAEGMRVLEDAFLLAKRLGHARAGLPHVLISLIKVRDVRVVFARLGVRLADIQRRLAVVFSQIEKGATMPDIQLERLVLHAAREALHHDLPRIAPLSILAALLQDDSPVRDVLEDVEVNARKLSNAVLWIMFEKSSSQEYQTWQMRALKKPKGVMNRSYTAIATPLLDSFSRDLTLAARVGALRPMIDRERELDEIFRIFESGRRGVLLSGFPGVGKRSIVEGIAARMASEDVPEILRDKRCVELNVTSFAGSSGRQGELEERFLRILSEISRAGNIVLFIENIDSLVGLSTEGAQNLDASHTLVQAMEQIGFPVIATTTPIKYREIIERTSLMGAFERVSIQEMESDAAIQILEGNAGFIEYRHKVFFTYDALEKSVDLSSRYLHDQYLPEKAVTLLEEVATYAATARGKDTFVTGEDVATVISQRTNVPVTRVTEEESEKLLRLEKEMHKRIVGQEEAVSAVASALRRARAELRDQKRPIATFLFMGPTGVGKTELAKTVAEVYFGNERNMIRLDMSEYQDQSAIQRLIGVPGGVTGGYLTEAVRSNSFSLVLLDELEKAHPDVLNIFLQVMDDGRLTDVMGRTVDFTNTIIIATSNAGSDFIQDSIRDGSTLAKIKEQLLNVQLRQYFRPEFLNRFDGVVVFAPLTFEQIVAIVHLMLADVSARLESRGITLQASDAAVEELARVGFDPIFGARPLRRAIQERVDNALAESLLTRKIGRRDVAVLEPGGKISIKKAAELV